jgi:hypothetical protein
MSEKSWWVKEAIQWSLWAVAMVVVMGWLGRSRMKGRPERDTSTLVHPTSTLILGVVCFGFFAGLAIVSNVFANKTTTWWTTTIFVGFAGLSAPMLIDYFVAKHKVSSEGLQYRKLPGRKKYLGWAELQSVRYSAGMKWFVLTTKSGEVARLSVMLMGLPEFARQVLEHAPEGAIEAETLAILQATAEGNPPSLWN